MSPNRDDLRSALEQAAADIDAALALLGDVGPLPGDHAQLIVDTASLLGVLLGQLANATAPRGTDDT